MRNIRNVLIATFFAVILTAGLVDAATIPYFTGPQDPSQLNNNLNYLINEINAYFSGTTAFSSIALSGSTSGTTTLAASATASGTATFPAATDTVAELTQAQTLTNKTLTSPTINGGTLNGAAVTGPAPSACGSTCTLTAANSGQSILLNTASGSVATLPAATGTGNKFVFIVTTTVTSNNSKILAASSSDSLQGLAFTEDSATVTGYTSAIATGNHSIYLNGSTTGGFQGDSCTFTDAATNVWQVKCDTKSTGTAATPFNTAST